MTQKKKKITTIVSQIYFQVGSKMNDITQEVIILSA